MNTKLIKFHLSLKNEYSMILKDFNIIFYGFGCKKYVLEQIFPTAYHFNMVFYDLTDVEEQIKLTHNIVFKDFFDLDNKLDKDIVLILYSFDFSHSKSLKNLKKIHLVFTLDNISAYILPEHVEQLNAVFRDLTTYLNYEDEVINLTIDDSKLTSITNIVTNVPLKSRTLFKEILLFDKSNVDFDSVFEKVKRKLFLVNKKSMLSLLTEFIDHKLIKIKENNLIAINIPKRLFTNIIEAI